MMINPPIDKLVEKTQTRYGLVSTVIKRARALTEKRVMLLEDTSIKPISYAAHEVYTGKVYMQME